VTAAAAWHPLIDRGPIVEVTVGSHPSFLSKLLAMDIEPASLRVPLLVDTGAKHTIIEQHVLDLLHLEAHAFIHLTTPGGAIPSCPTYHAELKVHVGGGPVILGTSVVGLAGRFEPNLAFKGLLGRSALKYVHFDYDGPGGLFKIWKPAR